MFTPHPKLIFTHFSSPTPHFWSCFRPISPTFHQYETLSADRVTSQGINRLNHHQVNECLHCTVRLIAVNVVIVLVYNTIKIGSYKNIKILLN